MPYEQSMIAAFRSMGLRLAQRRQMRHAFTIGDVIDGQLLVSEDESVSIQLEGRHVDLERALEICKQEYKGLVAFEVHKYEQDGGKTGIRVVLTRIVAPPASSEEPTAATAPSSAPASDAKS